MYAGIFSKATRFTQGLRFRWSYEHAELSMLSSAVPKALGRCINPFGLDLALVVKHFTAFKYTLR